MKKIEYILGLDLGISSVGWAVITRQSKETEWYLDDFGVRLFPIAESQDTSSRGKTLASLKRDKRSSRRLRRRRFNRKNDLINLLANNNFITEEILNKYLSTHPATSLVEYDRNKFYNPYYLRYLGSSEKLSKPELVWSLIHIANRRGYFNKFLLEEDNKKTKISSSIDKADEIISKYNSISEAIIKDEAFKEKNNNKLIFSRNRKSHDDNENYRYLFSRKDYETEIEKLLNNQINYYPELKELKEEISTIIFRQRDFEVGPGPKDEVKREQWAKKFTMYSKSYVDLMGRCSKYIKEKVGFKSSILFDIYLICAELSKITQFLDKNEKLCQLIINSFLYEWGGKGAKSYLKTILKQDINFDKKAFDSPGWKNIELKLSYLPEIIEIFGQNFIKNLGVNIKNLNNGLIAELGKVIYENKTPKRREGEIRKLFKNKNLNISEQQLSKLLKINSTTSRQSFKYMQEAVEAFYSGISIGTFNAEFDQKLMKLHDEYNQEKIEKYLNKEKEFKEFAPIIDPDLWKNPIVFRAINETRKVLKALFKKYVTIDQINIETTRELGKSYKDRQVIISKQDQGAINNAKAKEELNHLGISTTFKNIEKYKLWKNQNHKCMYSQREIDIKDLDSPNLEIDHIIPYSKLGIDSFDNKVLVYRNENQNKGNRTPIEWLKSNNDKLNKYIKFVNTLYHISKQKREYLLLESADGESLQTFLSRDLNDTRYIARYISNWLKYEFNLWDKFGIQKPNIETINGAVTSRFRRLWLRNSAWGLETKIRDITPWHHAVDAIILANFSNFSHITFATDIANLINYKRKNNQEEYDKFFNEIIQKWKDNGKKKENAKKALYAFNPIERLNKLKYFNSLKEAKQNWSNIHPALVKNLAEVIEKRMPIILEIEGPKIEEKTINKKDNKKVEIKIYIPKFKKVKEQKEYYFENKNSPGNIHYPFPSWFINKKLKGDIFGSELIVNKKGEKDKKTGLRKNNVYIDGKLNEERFYKDSKNQIWEDTKYYALGICKVNDKYKIKWFKKNELFKDKKLKQNWSLLFKNTTVCYKNKENKNVYKEFQSKMGDSIYASFSNTKFNSIFTKSKDIFGFQNSYDTISNWFNDLKILQIDILGKTKLIPIKEFKEI